MNEAVTKNKHPKGLGVLFTTEMWERFNFYGMRTLLTLFLANGVHLGWRDVLPGAALTAVLFMLGKLAIGFYLGQGRFGTAYGAAGSILILLVWIYYSAQILFFGAEFTQVYVRRRRPPPPVAEHAVAVTEAARAREGVPHGEPPTADDNRPLGRPQEELSTCQTK